MYNSPSRLYLYADVASLSVLEGGGEKVFLVGGCFGNQNFGDILQLKNTAKFYRQLGRFNSVAVFNAYDIGDFQFPGFACQAFGVDAVVFVSSLPLSGLDVGAGLLPVRIVRHVEALHLYGGGFLNNMWGDSVFNITEHFLELLKPPTYVVSGQQITPPFESRVLQHIQAYQPILFSVRDGFSEKLLAGKGYKSEYSFDDATEALLQLTDKFSLKRAPGLLLHINSSDYTANVTSDQGLVSELKALAVSSDIHNKVTVFQAFADQRIEIVDTRESIKQLERFFPFTDYRFVELAFLACGLGTRPIEPFQGDFGYSCSYHFALWLQLSGIPCWLRVSNPYYWQKAAALQVKQDFVSYLRDPCLADHTSNLDQRQKWLMQLSHVISDAPSEHRVCEIVDSGNVSSPWRFKGNASSESREVPDQLAARVGELGTELQVERQRAERAELASLELANRLEQMQNDLTQARLHNQSLLQSSSWRLTGPLRFIARMLRNEVAPHKKVRATGGDGGPISVITTDDRELISRIRSEKLTYLSDQKLFCLLDTCRSIEDANLPGVYIEAGCALGGSAILIAKTKKSERPFFVYDVFEMIPPPTEKDTQDVHDRYKIITDGKSVGIGGDKYYGYQENLYDVVQSNFRKFGIDCNELSVTLVKGLVRDTMKIDQSIAFAHIDVDWYETVITCLKRFLQNLVVGGIIILDDYHDWGV